MRAVTLALALGWWFYAYPADRIDFESARIHGPYDQLSRSSRMWQRSGDRLSRTDGKPGCLDDALDLEWHSRGRLLTSQCFWGDP